MTPLEELLSNVDSREKLIAFIEALASEREEAEQEERANPGRYRLDETGGARVARTVSSPLTQSSR